MDYLTLDEKDEYVKLMELIIEMNRTHDESIYLLTHAANGVESAMKTVEHLLGQLNLTEDEFEDVMCHVETLKQLSRLAAGCFLLESSRIAELDRQFKIAS